MRRVEVGHRIVRDKNVLVDRLGKLATGCPLYRVIRIWVDEFCTDSYTSRSARWAVGPSSFGPYSEQREG